MRKLLTTFVFIATAFAVGCGKKKDNTNNIATTPLDCYNQGLNPVYYQNNPWGQYNQYNQYPNSAFNPNNVGCMGPYSGNGIPTQNYNGSSYYNVSGFCSANSPFQSCLPGYRCVPTNVPFYQPGFQFQVSFGFNAYNPYAQRPNGVCVPTFY
jgi:hypothetical protein